jgi:hypothetical protein
MAWVKTKLELNGNLACVVLLNVKINVHFSHILFILMLTKGSSAFYFCMFSLMTLEIS